MKDVEKEIAKGFTQGLLGGFAGKGHVHDAKRGGIVDGKASHVKVDGGQYHDEWFTGERTGGGQEVLVLGDQKYTRVYTGGSPDRKALEELGVSEKDVSYYLVEKLDQLGEKTRLFEDCTPEPDDKWQYAYRVTDRFEEIGTLTGIETIHFDSVRVHVHAFAMCPIV